MDPRRVPAFVAALAVLAPLVTATNVTHDALTPTPSCALLPSELASVGLSNTTESQLVSSEIHRNVRPLNETFIERVIAVAAATHVKPSMGDLIGFEETRIERCVAHRRASQDLDQLLATLTLGAPRSTGLLALVEDTTLSVTVSTRTTQEVSLDEHAALAAIMLRGSNALNDSLTFVRETSVTRVLDATGSFDLTPVRGRTSSGEATRTDGALAGACEACTTTAGSRSSALRPPCMRLLRRRWRLASRSVAMPE